eukprot:TRINITY_DN67556_c0_g1_i1.p1 TRINITY_DN67556_c0_g1~~TRINITY_DN67556_c0_g1_i1.p1  ORF type:complete len:981 (+),score=123.43 TRINITY_DN67556_c0_g1_i1:141-3083(+)
MRSICKCHGGGISHCGACVSAKGTGIIPTCVSCAIGVIDRKRRARRCFRFYQLGLAGIYAFLVTVQAVGENVVADDKPSTIRSSELDLELFDDADCVEGQNSAMVLDLMNELCDVMDGLTEQNHSAESWATFRRWRSSSGGVLLQLAATVLARPYCEPGKVSLAASTCIMLLDQPGWSSSEQDDQANDCVKDVETLLQDTVPEGAPIYSTRLHMFLNSPWPAFRLLDTLVVHWPNKSATKAMEEMAPCRSHQDGFGAQIEFDWPWFREALNRALSAAKKSMDMFVLDPADGPLSEQYRARHARLYRIESFREVAAFGGTCFYKFRRNQWEAGCHPGVVASYIMQVITFSIRDTEAWLQRYVGAAWRLLILLTPFTSLIHSEWPIFRALHIAGLLRRHPVPWRPGRGVLPRAGQSPVRLLEARVEEVMRLPWPSVGHGDVVQCPASSNCQPELRAAYLTAAWGVLASPAVLGAFLARWLALGLPRLLVLAMDKAAAKTCTAHERPGTLDCLNIPQHLGVEAFVAKYLALAFLARKASLAVWLDLDVYLPADPTPRLEAAVAPPEQPPLALGGFLTTQTLSPSVIAARGGEETATLFLQYAAWLFENPYILDHQGWDAFVQNREGDFGVGWDYKGRTNVSHSPGDGLEFSFAPAFKHWRRSSDTSLHVGPQFVRLGPQFASGDGWRGAREDIASFHFWGAAEGPLELFETFYPFEGHGFKPAARALLSTYRRSPVSLDPQSVAARAAPRDRRDADHITAVSYAHGCCAQSILRNRDSALKVGVNAARAFGFDDLDPDWRARNEFILSQRKGAGWWLWKPRVILQTLLDDAVPWHKGVVLWLDAGNFYVGDPRPVIARAMADSDISAMRLKCCTESDWTSDAALRLLGGKDYVIADRPQLGAYFLMFRKTTTTLAFVEDWVRLSEDPEIIMESGLTASMNASANYQRHMADQSVFSVLFKQRGFQAMTLEEGHHAVQLDRWRE